MAADALADHLIARGDDVAVAYARTPSDCYLEPPEIVEDSAVRAATAACGISTNSRSVADAPVKHQGPNDALVKRLQRWLSIEAWVRDRTNPSTWRSPRGRRP